MCTLVLVACCFNQEEGRTALSIALMEQREDIADLIISIDDTDINAPDAIVSTATAVSNLDLLAFKPVGSPISDNLPHGARTQIYLKSRNWAPVLSVNEVLIMMPTCPTHLGDQSGLKQTKFPRLASFFGLIATYSAGLRQYK